MSKRRLVRGIGRITVCLTIIAVVIAVIAMPFIYKAKKINDFVNNAEIVEVVVGGGHGIKHYEGQFRPDFISIDQYHQLIKDLNDLPQNEEIYAGQIFKFYK